MENEAQDRQEMTAFSDSVEEANGLTQKKRDLTWLNNLRMFRTGNRGAEGSEGKVLGEDQIELSRQFGESLQKFIASFGADAQPDPNGAVA